MPQLTNYTGISLPLAVWLAEDTYDFKRGTRKAISATSLLKSRRQILLTELMPEDMRQTPDVSDFIKSRMGTSFHDSIESAWKRNYRGSMKSLGFPDDVINRMTINPTHADLVHLQNTLPDRPIPIYLEQRAEREIDGYIITGKFDMVLDGELNDFKSTSAWAWVFGGKDEDYRLQGSIYRWLNPDKITKDHMHIQFIFTDWQRQQALSNPRYPQKVLEERRLDLMSLQETENWIREKIRSLEEVADLPEPELPHCTDKELWRSETVWKYYKDPTNMTRSTKNCSSEAEAQQYRATKGRGQGVILEIPGKPKACSYCAAFPVCTQKDLYDHD